MCEEERMSGITTEDDSRMKAPNRYKAPTIVTIFVTLVIELSNKRVIL